MSFSSSVKNELCRVEINKKCCMYSELAAVIRIGGVVNLSDGEGISISITTENAAFARRVFSLAKSIFKVYPQVIIRKGKKLKKHTLYIVVISSSLGVHEFVENIGLNLQVANSLKAKDKLCKLDFPKMDICCKRAYLRGTFLAGGSISDPEKTYHLEITNHSMESALEVCSLMKDFGLNPKIIKRKNSFITYLKEGEDLVDFLNVTGAHTALLEMENVRILKEMRNNVNRLVNCETANLDKTVNASVRHIENIKYINEHIGFGKLPKGLREIAELRLKYKDASLKELGEMLDPPLGKSGVNHRLRKLDRLAQQDRELKGEKK